MSQSFYLPILIEIAGATFPSDDDRGTGTDDINDVFLVSLTDSDTATATETSALNFAGADTGTGTDSGSRTITSTDTGTGTDTGTVVRTVTDEGVGTDTGVISLVSYTGTDTGEGTEGTESTNLYTHTILATGIMSKIWSSDIEQKWSFTATKRWSARMVDRVDQIS